MGVTIQLSDEQAAALKAQAAAQGLTLEDWLARLAAGKLAGMDEPLSRSHSRKGRYNLSELMERCDPNAQLTPEDLAWMDSPPVGREV